MSICLHQISKTINHQLILDKISYTFETKTVYGLHGINGCGKTMLMRAICGLINLSSGHIAIDGEVLHQDISFPRSIGALIENPAFLPLETGYRNLKLLAGLQGGIDEQDIVQMLCAVNLEPEDTRSYRKFSLGMKQKLGIAAAFLGFPNIILLDEPLNAIDEQGVEFVHQLVHQAKSKGCTLLLACHNKDELLLMSDVVIQMDKGKFVI